MSQTVPHRGSSVDGSTLAPVDAAEGTGRRGLLRRVSPKAWFLLGLMVLFAVYTDMAFDLQWRTEAGRIGPGYFPRIIGVLSVVLTAIVFAIDLRSDVHEVIERGETGETVGHVRRHPRMLMAFVAACVGFVVLLTYLGAMIATGVFLFGTLLLLDPGHRVRAAIIASIVPVLLYLGFDLGLNAGLPGGIFDTY